MVKLLMHWASNSFSLFSRMCLSLYRILSSQIGVCLLCWSCTFGSVMQCYQPTFTLAHNPFWQLERSENGVWSSLLKVGRSDIEHDWILCPATMLLLLGFFSHLEGQGAYTCWKNHEVTEQHIHQSFLTFGHSACESP